MADATPPDGMPVIRLGIPIMVRPGNRVHIGADPDRAIVVDLDPAVEARRLAALLELLRRPMSRGDLAKHLDAVGLTADDLTAILDRLVANGSAVAPHTPDSNSPRLRVSLHGRGPLSSLLMTSLSEVGLFVGQSTKRSDTVRALESGDSNLVVLTDFLVHDPTLIDALLIARAPHLQVRVRDNVGLIGPLVLPRMSSCLRCADLHRAGLDPDWPVLAAQLVRRPGQAATATTRATAALAHDQIEKLGAALRRPSGTDPPALLNQVLHFRPDPVGVEFSSWPPHPLCGCRTVRRRDGAWEYDTAAG